MVVIIDPQNSGIAGNMLAGAFVDLGVNPNEMKEFMEFVANDFGGVKVHINKTNKSGIQATYLEVELKNESNANNHDSNVDSHDSNANSSENNVNNHSISYNELIEIIDKIENTLLDNKSNSFLFIDLANKEINEIFNISRNVFSRIANGESKVHGKSLDKIHFHEVGAADAVADVFGSVYGYCKLNFNKANEKVIGLPIALGGGTSNTTHGRIPIPAPATVTILNNSGANCFGGPVNIELATPTGVALYLELCDEFKDFQPIMKPTGVGHGAGKKDLDFPNVLRIVTGEYRVKSQAIDVIETNIDHLSGEMIGYLFEKLINEGASDVAIIPIIMKKNRSGQILKVISRKDKTEKLLSIIFKETGTLGIRVSENIHRGVANREFISLDVDIAGKKEKITFKVGSIGNEIISSRGEYEDLKRIANKRSIPLNEIMEIANFEIKRYLSKREVNEKKN